MSIIWIEKASFSQTVFQPERSSTCDLIREIPETNYMERLKSIIFIMNGAWIALEDSWTLQKEESDFSTNSSPNRHICL